MTEEEFKYETADDLYNSFSALLMSTIDGFETGLYRRLLIWIADYFRKKYGTGDFRLKHTNIVIQKIEDGTCDAIDLDEVRNLIHAEYDPSVGTTSVEFIREKYEEKDKTNGCD